MSVRITDTQALRKDASPKTLFADARLVLHRAAARGRNTVQISEVQAEALESVSLDGELEGMNLRHKQGHPANRR
jgi:hypothetical protein